MVDSRRPARKVDFLSISEPKRGARNKNYYDRSRYVYENKGSLDKVSTKKQTFTAVGAQLSDILYRPHGRFREKPLSLASPEGFTIRIAAPYNEVLSPAPTAHVGHAVGKIRRGRGPVGGNAVCTVFGARVWEPVTTPALSRGPS